MELKELDSIITARRADPRQFATPAENPYRIQYAVYNLTDPQVIAKLTEASRAGIHVQLLIDSHQISPDRPWNTVVDELKGAGFSHADTHKGLTEAQRRDTQIIEIDMGRGLFHLKARTFRYPDPQTGALKETLLTGSHNPQESAHKNDESLHRVTDPGLIAKYSAAIEALKAGKPIQNTWDDAAPVNVLFTSPTAKGTRVADKLFSMIREEKELIFISVFTLRNITNSEGRSKLVDELAAAKARGVKVTVVTDHKQADGVDADGNPRPDATPDETEDLLRAAGIPTYEVTNRAGPHTAMHLKSAVFGLTDMKVVTDAGNWTYATMGSKASKPKNAESVLFIDSKKADGNKTGMQYLGEYLAILRRYAPQNHGGPEVEGLIRELQATPGWPKVKVNFDVVARTNWGQDVYVVGNTPELGGWGQTGPGLKLDTDASTYPSWKARDLELPLGTTLEYKVVKRNPDGRLDWEPGQNAVLVVDNSRTQAPHRLDVADDFNGDR
jgi:predicted metal-dependent phosphoesterase TrpH